MSVSTSTLAATIKISNHLNLRHKSVIIPSSSSSISFFSSSARTRSFAITLLKPIRATAQQKCVYPDPIPEFSEAETLKFRAELTKKLLKDKDEFGDQIYDVVNVCTEIFNEFLNKDYGGPGTLMVEPFTDMLVALKERKLPGAPLAVRTSLLWAQNYVDQDWDLWNGKLTN